MQRALVTGATSGIGCAIATTLARNGYAVIAVGRDKEALTDLAKQSGIEPMPLDLTDRPAVEVALGGRDVDVLVNNAGMLPALKPFELGDQTDFDRTISLNLAAPVHLTKLIAPGMCGRKRGHIFFTGSTAGHAPFANLAVYCASKYAIAGFAEALRLDMAEHGVRVTEIVPGRTETGLWKDIVSEDVRANMYAGNTAVQPQNIADMVLAVLNMPPNVDVSRFDIVPTRQATPTGVRK